MKLAGLTAKGLSNIPEYLATLGRVFYTSDADQDDALTGQTSFAATTPTIMIDVPLGQTVIPLMVNLHQTGTVAGGAITVITEIDNADRYNTGGTAETTFCSLTTGGDLGGTLPTGVAVYSGATANAGYGVRLDSAVMAQDVDPAVTEASQRKYLWTPQAGLDYVVGPGAFLVYTYAATTGPTWLWTIKFAVIPTDWVGSV